MCELHGVVINNCLLVTIRKILTAKIFDSDTNCLSQLYSKNLISNNNFQHNFFILELFDLQYRVINFLLFCTCICVATYVCTPNPILPDAESQRQE